MVMIRFSRMGKKKQVSFRLIVSDKAKDTKNRYLELLGHYSPHTKKAVLKTDRIQYWISVGAQLSNSVNNLLVKEGVIKGDKMKSVNITKKRHEKIEKAKPAPVVEKPAEEKVEAEPKAAETAAAETPEVKAEESPKE